MSGRFEQFKWIPTHRLKHFFHQLKKTSSEEQLNQRVCHAVDTSPVQQPDKDSDIWLPSSKLPMATSVIKSVISKESLFLYRAEHYITRRIDSLTNQNSSKSEAKKLACLLDAIRVATASARAWDEKPPVERSVEAQQRGVDVFKEALDKKIEIIFKQAAQHRNFYSFSFFSQPKSYQILHKLYSECQLTSARIKR